MSNSPTHWVMGDGDLASIGDYVALDINPDSVGQIADVADDHTGRPVVILTEGPGAGRKLPVWPAQILLKVFR